MTITIAALRLSLERHLSDFLKTDIIRPANFLPQTSATAAGDAFEWR